MANRQIHQLTAEASLDSSFVIPIQKADGSVEAKKVSLENLKDVLGSSVTKVLKTTITSAQILALFDTPITVLDSTDPLTIKLPINIWVQRKAGTAYTLAAASFLLVNDIGGNVTGNLNPNPLTGSSIGFFTSAYTITQNSAGVDRNVLYKLKASTGNPTGGTGDIDVYVTYIEITL
jgi:hypothetical protein